MEIIGTIIILLILVGSYVLFSHQKKEKIIQINQKNKSFYEQLERQMKEHVQRSHTVVYAGGDGNSEISISDAIKSVSMPEGKRIRYE